MSEEISSNDTNLYTTEDAFEQFQAVSTCEEDDFITLSDILPPASPEHNPVSELDDVPYDNEVVLPAFLELSEQEASAASTPCIQDSDVNTTTLAESDVVVSAQQSAETCDQPALPIINRERPKRGRKKRESTATPASKTGEADNVVHNNIKQNENFESTLSSSRPRRGRKPKQIFDMSLNSSDCKDNSLQTVNSKKRGRGKPKINKGKRPKKESFEKAEIKEINGQDGLAEISTAETEFSDTSANIIKKTSRRTVQKKHNLTDVDNSTGLHESNLIMDSTLRQSGSNVPKRTRKKKVVHKMESDDDDEDYKSLSQIKKDGPKVNGDDSLNMDDPISKVIPQELGVESQFILNPPKQDEKLSTLLNDIVGTDQMLSDSAETEVVVESTDMEIDIVGTEETKFFPVIPNTNLLENESYELKIEPETKIEQVEPKKENESDDNNLLVEDTTKRPVRRKARKTLQYDEGSDEDPFANVELSDDDEPKRRKKGKKYYSDDEYVPGKKERSSSSEPDSDIDNHDGILKPKRKRGRILSQNKSPRKKNLVVEETPSKITPDVATITPANVPEDDIEGCLQTSVIKAPEEFNQFKERSSHNSEFENFIAKKIHGSELQIKKVSTLEPIQNTPIEIPVLELNEIKKAVESSTQTNSIKMETAGVQTSTPYDAVMKKNITLSSKQSEKACEFLKSVVKTTAELGQLMTQKSEDFIDKKINTDHVTDTLKMDYCIRKSFLLFKLAKHNLMQMEEDLSKQYEEFLKQNNLESCMEKPKEVVAKAKAPDSDSDCEIVEETKPSTAKQTSKFNPKTVFLNKELSIKIAKKPSTAVNKTPKKELNIKGRHSVWISDSVMVKKVKPTQSFLAQDSRNKKPPDTYVTEKMVSDFFEEYSRKKIQQTCAAFTSTEWLAPLRTNMYSYYFVKSDSFSDTAEDFSENDLSKTSELSGSASDVGNKLSPATTAKIVDKEHSGPESLSALCTHTLQKILHDPLTNGYQSQSLINHGHNNEKLVLLEKTGNPRSLFQLCINFLLQGLNYQSVSIHSPSLSNGYSLNGSSKVLYNALSLKQICSSRIIELCSSIGTEQSLSVISPTYSEYEDSTSSEIIEEEEDFIENNKKCEVKSLFSLCVELIQKHQQANEIIHTFTKGKTDQNVVAGFNPDYLKHIAFETVKFLMYKKSTIDIDSDLYFINTVRKTSIKYKVRRLADICFEMVSKFVSDGNDEQCNESVKLTINSVNTLSEEAFHNIDETCLNTEDNSQFFEEDDDTNYYDEDTFEDSNTNNFEEDSQTEECNWVSKLQVKELMSCLSNEKNMNDHQVSTDGESPNNSEEQTVTARIKIEPEEEIPENVLEPAIVKTEAFQNLDEMTVIPDGVVPKQENEELLSVDPIAIAQERVRRGSFDMNTFEDFVQNNKMMHIGEYSGIGDEIFSQSGLRVRRQYEPDSDTENVENDLNDLLVPQTFEPLTIETAKGHLMESSSEEDSASKKTDKKKPDKRSRGRPKKSEKQQTTKEKVAPATPPNEVARLTKRMRDKIRQEEKKVESSDSDTETLPMSKKKEKTKSDTKKIDNNKLPDEEIQCSNVDSTEQLEKVSPGNDNFPGFSAVDQNEITSYQKYVKFVYDKIMPKDGDIEVKGRDTESNQTVSTSAEDPTPLINPDEPVEMLECEPTMPIFDEETINTDQKKTRRSANKQKAKQKTAPEEKIKLDVQEGNNKQDNLKQKEKTEGSTLPYTERDGWKCYPISSNETKLYQNAGIILEKLPESFVETYFRYQNISNTRKEDEEVNRLINLNTLKRSGNLKDSKTKQKVKGKESETQVNENVSDGSRAASPAHSDRYDELTPSEDEANVDDEVPPPAPRQGSGENNLAKNLLMGDSDSDAENRIKTEPKDESETPSDKSKKKKPSPKSKGVEKTTESPENLMLTADKMMNKELSLLHAPVVLDDKDSAQTSTPKGGPVTRQKHKGESRHLKQGFGKNDDDSSSEEEKQWVSTKEKLLKRMGKKDCALEDDAKRAKLVTEFIERRGDDSQKRRRGVGRPRKLSHRALLEREKQLRVLSKEMMSEGERLHPAKQSQSYFKGRRNIRKVIDKKSLQRSTVIANMEEFERKCRLNQRQARLREILGCEEGVNVVVMNDELCLEYDFEGQQAAVAVHPFFTRVMKAHQYEGVKFMWDACFESLEKVESGHKGGGCILAHCMGLGKTLQVLALLHTVLTHPRVGTQRVLVCCPLSTVLNWVDEIHKWIGPVTDQIKVFELSKLKKTYERAYQLEDWYNGGGIFIIGYELFRSLSLLDPVLDDVRPTIVNKITSALLDPGPDIVICDEGHLLKNDCSVLAMAMSRVQTRRRIVLTGTPMQNNLREYYCMVNFVKPNLLGTYSEYSNRFENPIMNGQHRDSQEEDIKLMKQRTHILHKVLEGCLQRQEASVLYPYLPKKHEYTVFIPLTQCQWDLYKHYMHAYANQSKQSVLKDFHILQKIWSHPQVLHNFFSRWKESKVQQAAEKVKPEKVEDDLAQEDLAASTAVEMKPDETETWWLQYLDGGKMLDTLASSNKFVAVFRILDECIQLGDKVLIFSTSLITMDSLEFFLKKINKWSLGQEYYRLDGSVPAEVRQKWCREYNAENNHKTKLFLISTRAGCLGLNMVAANRVIILDTSWNPAHDIQSIFRVYRFGQKKDCYIYRLVALGTMEQKIYERSVTKQAVACRVVDEQQIDRHYNMAELTELYKYDEFGVSVAGGVAIGVEDVALLRVARVAAVHAVHEHDSLLRGSSEQALEEHERNAAWMQFQQEQTHKQIQNHLTPMPPLVKRTNRPKMEQPNTPQLLQPPEIKTEDQAPPMPITYPLASETKSKRGRKSAQVKPQPQTLAIDDAIVQKIMNILIKHNYQQRQGPREISELVASVRKIVAYGKVPPKLGLNQELTQSIANVLLGRDSPPQMAPLTDVDPTSFENTRRKQQFDNLREPEEILPSTSSLPDPVDGRRRRRAALAAKMQIDSLVSDAVIDLDDDDWHGGSDTDEAPETARIEQSEKPKAKSKKDKQILVQTEKQLNSEINSILLSDEDDTPSKKRKDKNVDSGEVVPLHPSLLSNKNFIKIVAHTYLEGNPMLDEDAATLAAQYSTLKALKEFESTGQKIESGPIYDIAIKVLGRDILKKLNKSNPAIPTPSAPSISKPDEIKKEPEPEDSRSRPSGRVKPKGISELMAPRKASPAASPTVPVVAPPKAPMVAPPAAPPVPPDPPRRRGRPSRAAMQAAQAPAPPAQPVVPVGLIKMGAASQPVQPMAPAHAPPQPQPYAPPAPAREESILPDDDVIFSHPIKTEDTPRRNSQPLILNSVLSSNSSTHVIVHKNMTPQIQISSGNIVMAKPGVPLTTMAPMNMVPQTTSQDTICLDSDEEESITPNLPTKRVALKSTTKRPVPATKTSFKAEPQHGAPQTQPSSLPPNCIVIPASEFQKLRKLPMGVIPIGANVNLINQFQPNVMEQQNMMQQSYMQQNMNLATSMPQNVNMMGTQNRNLMNTQTLNYNQVSAQNMPLMNTVQSMPLMHTQNMTQMNTVQSMPLMHAQNMPQMNTAQSMSLMTSLPQMNEPQTSPQSILPTPTEPSPMTSQQMQQLNKTVCKPGDILRITKTGQVEILNREDQPVNVGKPVEAAAAAAPAAPAPGIAKKSTTKPPFPKKNTPSKKITPSDTVCLDDDTEKERSPEVKKTYKRVRKISSSSSSSSESSRASSPEGDPSDPLSILKDVVHIRAADEEYSTTTKKSTSKPPNIKSITIKHSSSPEPVKNSVTITPTKDKVMSLINQTDSMLKQLNSVLSSDKKSSKSKVDTKSHKVVGSVDLTDLDTPSTSSTLNKLSKNITVGKTTTKAGSSPQTSLLKKTTPSSGSSSATKVVGKSSNIILRNTGGKKQVIVVNERKQAAPAAAPPPANKRAAPAAAPPPAAKKKKNEPMTLKDFDIDDFDDIIELD